MFSTSWANCRWPSWASRKVSTVSLLRNWTVVYVGNLVGSGSATLLTSITVYSPIYVFFHISERDLFSFQASSAERRRHLGREWEDRDPTALYVGRAGEEGFPHTGIVDFTDQADDAFRRFADAGMHLVRSTDPIETSS